MTPGMIVLLVVGILAVQALLWIPIILWLRSKSAKLLAALRDELAAAGERVTLGPEPGLYRGGTGSHPGVKGNGIIALTERRLIIRKLVGQGLTVPVDQVTAVREDQWFLSSYTSGRLHVIVQTQGGAELGFIVPTERHASWMAALRALEAPVA